MLAYAIHVQSPADEVLYEGLPHLAPVLEEFGSGALLIGGMAAIAWLTACPVGLPVRATRDIDLGINAVKLGISKDHAPVQPLLKKHGFKPGFGGESFRFSRHTSHGPFVVDLLVAKGASKADPPEVERGLPSLAAPGLAYAVLRGPVPMQLTMHGPAGEQRMFTFSVVTLDAAFVMKATLVASGSRRQAARRVTDTTDAIMLAAACLQDDDAMTALASHRRRSEPKRALAWLTDAFSTPTSAAARRVADTAESPAETAAWTGDVATRFIERLNAVR